MLSLISLCAHQDMPDVLIGSFEAAEADADPQKPLAPPRVARRDGGLPHGLRLAVVQQHLDGQLHVGFQQLLQRVVVPPLSDMDTFESVWR